jgi:hypothetical protein
VGFDVISNRSGLCAVTSSQGSFPELTSFCIRLVDISDCESAEGYDFVVYSSSLLYRTNVMKTHSALFCDSRTDTAGDGVFCISGGLCVLMSRRDNFKMNFFE